MAKPKFEPIHRGIVAFWVVALVVTILVVLSQPRYEGAWEGIYELFALAGLIIGGSLIALSVAVARLLLTGRYERAVALALIPALLPLWLMGISGDDASPYSYPPESTWTGLATDHIPDHYEFYGTGGGPHEDYDVYLETEHPDSELIIGIRREAMVYETDHQVSRGGRVFLVVFEEDRVLVVEDLGMVKVEVSSNALSEEVLVDVAESTWYYPDLDRRHIDLPKLEP